MNMQYKTSFVFNLFYKKKQFFMKTILLELLYSEFHFASIKASKSSFVTAAKFNSMKAPKAKAVKALKTKAVKYPREKKVKAPKLSKSPKAAYPNKYQQ